MAEDYSVRSPPPSQPFQSMDKVKIVNRAQHETIMKLIEAVRKFPVLYNSKRTDYRDVDLKRHYWHQVQAETKIATVEECQKLWKTLRDRFIRETRVLENNEKLTGSSETAAAAAVRWPYYEALMFYRNCGRSPRTYLSSSSTSSSSTTSRRVSLPPPAVLNSSGEDNNTSSSLNSTQSNEEHHFPSHQAFIEAVFRQAQTRLETPSPSSSQESIPLALARDLSSPNLSHHYGPPSPQVAVAVVRPISPGALVNATSSMALVSCESSTQSIHEESGKSLLNDSNRSDKFAARSMERDESETKPATITARTPDDVRDRGRSVSKAFECNDTGIDGQALNLSVHGLNRSVREFADEEPEPKKQKTSDEDELFALSLVPSLKRLGAKVKSLTKIKILQQLVMAEFGAEEECQE
ncbi:uncharacterized protein LOC111271535 isoform X1 [Varroa jacobsoni]|uniref:uncharacterized protein LOC111271535 isoform X1 n=1 Tax=Varroa jacobsoni TaxID=62625 RepID=UPI000BF6F6FB|nr:uncharacterized protein LOC111271535 isoform X1 [Varroa jacobsoni]XP_022708145.1 uncharacterized protein LOC111271535 isoform X1 [Varroa jacobsoni]